MSIFVKSHFPPPIPIFLKQKRQSLRNTSVSVTVAKTIIRMEQYRRKIENTVEIFRDLLHCIDTLREHVLVFWDTIQDPPHARCLNQWINVQNCIVQKVCCRWTSSSGKSIFKTKAAGTLKGWPTGMGKGFIQSPVVRGAPDSFPTVSAPEQHYNMHAARHLVDSILKKSSWCLIWSTAVKTKVLNCVQQISAPIINSPSLIPLLGTKLFSQLPSQL